MTAFNDIERAEAARLTLGAAVSALAGTLVVAEAAAIAFAVDHFAGGPRTAVVAGAAAAILAVAIVRAALASLGGRIAFEAAARILERARATLAARVAARSPRNARRTPSGAIAALAADKLEACLPFLTRYRAARLAALVVPGVLLAATFAVSWAAALVLLVAFPLIPVFMAIVGIAARRASRRQMDEIGSMNAVFLDRLRGIVDIRLLDAADAVTADFAASAERLRARTMAVLRVAFLSSAVLELFAAVAIAVIAVYVGFSLLGLADFGSWGTAVTLGEGLFLLLLAPAFFQPLRALAAAWHDKAAAATVIAEFDEEVGRPAPAILGTGAAAAPLPGPAAIRLEAVSGVRGDGAPLSFEIAPGARVALVGPSGSGKTTLLQMIAGLAVPEGGRIVVAGRTLGEATADAWRARCAFVGQRPHFFAGSLAANVALTGRPGERDRMDRALRVAAAGGVVRRAVRGPLTPVGETGHGLSAGEARRLALARAAFAERDVILADEPTADLDPETARAVADGLMALAAKGATLVIATHDRALAERMDARLILGEA